MRPQTELAQILIRYLQGLGWEVFEEVRCDRHIADLVIRKHSEICVIECGGRFSTNLLDQARRWRPLASRVWVATWPQRQTVSASAAVADAGAGWFVVEEEGVREVRAPIVNSSPMERLGKLLFAEQQDGSFARAGSVSDRRFDAEEEARVRDCAEALVPLVARAPGQRLRDFLDHVPKCREHDVLEWAKSGRLLVEPTMIFGRWAIYTKPLSDHAVQEMAIFELLRQWRSAVRSEFFDNPFIGDTRPEQIPAIESQLATALAEFGATNTSPYRERYVPWFLNEALRWLTHTHSYMQDDFRGIMLHDAYSPEGYKVAARECAGCPHKDSSAIREYPRTFRQELPMICAPAAVPLKRAVVCLPFFEKTDTPVCRGARLLGLTSPVEPDDAGNHWRWPTFSMSLL